MASDPGDSERTRVAAWESVCGVVMLIGGVLLSRVGGVAGIVGLGLLFLGIGGLGHAVLYGLGLVDLPGGEERRSAGRKDDDARR
jgi:hypothetical protein